MKNKKEICVELTQKNIKKVYGILKMFPMEKLSIWVSDQVKNSDFDVNYIYLKYNGEEWILSKVPASNLIKPRELRNILFAENCKEGDYVVVSCAGEDFVAKFVRMEDNSIICRKWYCIKDKEPYESKNEGCFNNFVRYATQEEIELLEGKKEEPKELEVGNWYLTKRNLDEALICLQDDAYSYGFNYNAVFTDIFNSYALTVNNSRLATKEEVKSALVAEAKRRYPSGTKFIPLNGTHKVTVGSDLVFDYYGYITVAIDKKEWNKGDKMSNPTIYENGKWAEIIHQPKYTTLGTSIMLNGECVCDCHTKELTERVLGFLNSEMNNG